MQRKVLIATLLLPLPFAALPIIGVLFGMGGGARGFVVERAVEQRQMQFDSPNTRTNPLAMGVSDPLRDGCDGDAEARAES
ncbi:MAG: hypothetical protein ABIP13_10555 [Tepidiformaceae bacterium]